MAATHASGITMALEAGIADALTAYNTAKTAHTVAKTAHDEDASLDNANALKTAADTLLAAAMDAQEKGVLGATAEQQTALTSVSVTDAEGYVATAGDDVTTAQTAADAAAVVAATDAAKTKTAAIAEEADPMAADRGLGGSAVDPAVEAEAYTLAITRDRMGTTVEIGDPQMAGEDDPEFTLYKDLGHGRTMHTREMEADEDGNVVEEVVIVRTDIDAPKATPFAMVEGQALTANPKTTGQTDFRSITVEAGTADVNLPKIVAAAFTAGTAAELMFAFDVTNTEDEDEADEVAGTYNGAMGTYRCDGTAMCTVNIDAMGEISEIGTGWIFTPNMGVTSDVPDTDYLSYGFWLQKTTDDDGVLTYNEVETFADSSVDATGSVAQVTGSATYEGSSTGVYVRNVFDSLGDIDTATSGHFTADAVLKAYFGQTVDDSATTTVDEGGTIAPNLLNTLSGSITNFDLSGGEANSWAVNLQGPIDTGDGTATGTANGGGAAGAFNATFHGPATDADNGPIQPHTVVGEFDANFSNGAVAGGFGARN